MNNQTNAVATVTKPRALEVMAQRVNVDPTKLMGTLSATCFKGASQEEMLALVVVANEYGLNPFLKEIYAFPKKGGGIVPVVGIDGWIKMVNRAKDFDGVEFEMVDDPDGKPYACTCCLFIKDRSRPVKVTEYFSECHRNTEPWNMMPRRMLRHKALIQAARVGFGFAGISDEDEAIDITSTVVEQPRMISPAGNKVIAAPASDVCSEMTPQMQLSNIVTGSGFTFDDFAKWAMENKHMEESDTIAGFDEVPADVAKRMVKAKAGLISGIAAMKGGAQ